MITHETLHNSKLFTDPETHVHNAKTAKNG